MPAARRIRLTSRGLAMAALGGMTLVSGVLVGVGVLVQVGALLVVAVGAAVVSLLVEANAQERGRLRLVRHVTPHPVTVGERAVVQVDVTSTGGAHRLDRLQVAERAARELSGPTTLRARVHRTRGRLTLSYHIQPDHRGRWAVGPLEVQRSDIFGVARWRGPLGPPVLVAVRPRITRLSIVNRAASTDVDRVALGARTPSADDALLRDYQTGDDLRRVHWRSSARRGELVVRQDERSGRRPSSVLLDLPMESESAEWSISAAASLAVALVAAGHHVRLLGGDVLGASTDHHRPDTDGRAVDALLDQTVDLTLPPNRGTRDAWLLAAVDTLAAQGGGAELVFAVVGPLDADALDAMARVGADSHGWVMVRTGRLGHHEEPTPEERRTLEGLRRAGWAACAVTPGEDLTVCWDRLVDSHVHRVVTR
ncbi:MAG TPA: DUF58 domain-containing protein [Actinotalea sp.]|jgi:uncharacterized protein (DUF58 family)